MADAEKIDKKQVVKDIIDGRREFTFEHGNQVRQYFIADPSGEDVRKADWNYAKIFNSALADGFPTQAQMIDILTERGILSEEYSRKLEKAKIDLAAALYRLENMADEMTDEEREDLALETARLRDEFFRLNQKVNSPMGNTCENLAEDARNEYITSRVVQNKDGTRVWKSYEDYLSEENQVFVHKCRFEVMAWLNGIESDFIEKMPEQVALRRIAEKRLESALSLAKSRNEEVEELQLPENTDSEEGQVSESEANVVLDPQQEKTKVRRRGRPRKKAKEDK